MPEQGFFGPFRRVAIGKEELDGFAARKPKKLTAHFHATGPGEMEFRHDALQSQSTGFNGEDQSPGTVVHAQVEQKGRQPVASERVVVLW